MKKFVYTEDVMGVKTVMYVPKTVVMDENSNGVLVLDLQGRVYECATALLAGHRELWAQEAAVENPNHIYFFGEKV